jgi:DNA-binding NarL/FixJ family response regulator
MGLTLVTGPDGGQHGGSVVAPIRVVIAHGDGLARAGLRALLGAGTADIDVLAMAASGDEVAAAARELRPDVVIMDIGLPGRDGLQVVRQVLAEADTQTETSAGRVAILLLLGAERDGAACGALRAGARGLLGTDAEPDELVRAVRTVAGGEAVLAPRFAGYLIDEVLAHPEHLDSRPAQLDELTDREREVMALVAWGLSNHEIAERLIVSPATAKTHVSRAMLKLHAHDRTRLAVLAYQSGLVTAGNPAATSAATQRIAGRATHAAAA